MKTYKLINSKADFEPVFFNTEMNFNKARDLCYYIQDASNILLIHLDIILPNDIMFSFLQKFGAVKTEKKDCDFIIDMTNKNSDMVMCALNPNEKNIGSNFYDFTYLDELHFNKASNFIKNEMDLLWIQSLISDKKIKYEDLFEDIQEIFTFKMNEQNKTKNIFKLINSEYNFEPVYFTFNSHTKPNEVRDIAYFIKDSCCHLINFDVIAPNEIIFSFLKSLGAEITDKDENYYLIDISVLKTDEIDSEPYDFIKLENTLFEKAYHFIHNEMNDQWLKNLAKQKKIDADDTSKYFDYLFFDDQKKPKKEESNFLNRKNLDEQFLTGNEITTPRFILIEVLKRTKTQFSILDQYLKDDLQRLLLRNISSVESSVILSGEEYFQEYKNLYNALVKRKLKFTCSHKDNKTCCNTKVTSASVFVIVGDVNLNFFIAPLCEEHIYSANLSISGIVFKTTQDNMNFMLD